MYCTVGSQSCPVSAYTASCIHRTWSMQVYTQSLDDGRSACHHAGMGASCCAVSSCRLSSRIEGDHAGIIPSSPSWSLNAAVGGHLEAAACESGLGSIADITRLHPVAVGMGPEVHRQPHDHITVCAIWATRVCFLHTCLLVHSCTNVELQGICGMQGTGSMQGLKPVCDSGQAPACHRAECDSVPEAPHQRPHSRFRTRPWQTGRCMFCVQQGRSSHTTS